MAGPGLKPPLRLHSIDAIKRIEHAQKLRNICLITRRNDVQIERVDRRAIQNSRQAPHDDKLHAPFVKGSQRRQKITVRHLTFGSPGLR